MRVESYEIVDSHSGAVVGTYEPALRTRARRRADRLDNDYGAYRYIVRPVWIVDEAAAFTPHEE